MAELVTLDELKTFLGGVVGTSEDVLLTALRDRVQGALVSATGRQHAPFQDAEIGRQEVLDGTGTSTCWLAYPVASVASVLLGPNFAAPSETVPASALSVGIGSRRLVRTDGGTFGEYGAPRQVRVTYTTQADLPEIAKLAVLHATAVLYRQRGSEDASRERAGGYEAELVQLFADEPTWQAAIAQLREDEL